LAFNFLRIQLPFIERAGNDHRSPYLYIPCVEPVPCIFAICYYGMVMGIYPEGEKQTVANDFYFSVVDVCSQFVLHTYRPFSPGAISLGT